MNLWKVLNLFTKGMNAGKKKDVQVILLAQLQLQKKGISLVTQHPGYSSDGVKVAWQVRVK